MDQAVLRDIKPPVYFKTNYWPLIIILSLIVTVVIIYTAVYFIRRRLSAAKAGPFAPPKKAHETAYEALNILRSENLPASGRIKEYYIELSRIVRCYIEDRFSVKAPEMTTEEFLCSLRDSGILTGAQKNIIKQFLSQCDLVKFARYGPAPEEVGGSFNTAKRLIDQTRVETEDEKEALRR